jgi:hypothetical protein
MHFINSGGQSCGRGPSMNEGHCTRSCLFQPGCALRTHLWGAQWEVDCFGGVYHQAPTLTNPSILITSRKSTALIKGPTSMSLSTEVRVGCVLWSDNDTHVSSPCTYAGVKGCSAANLNAVLRLANPHESAVSTHSFTVCSIFLFSNRDTIPGHQYPIF